MRDLRDEAARAREKKAPLGSDVDLDAYSVEPVPHEEVEDLSTLSASDRTR